MASKYIRYIDLGEVCKALPYWKKNRGISTVPRQLWGTVVGAVLGFLAHPDFGLSREDRALIDPKKLADMLDSALALAWEARPSERLRYKKDRHKHKFVPMPPDQGPVYREIIGSIGLDEPILDALLVYQLDTLCGAVRDGETAKTLGVFADLLEIQRDIADREGRGFLEGMMSKASSWDASDRAKKRHAETNGKKAASLAEWDATGSEYESRADFARIISSRDGIKYRTLYDWIAAHEKTKT